MRFDTHKVRAQFVWELMATPGILDIHDDGTDIVVVRLEDGVRVMIHLIERLMPINELRALFRENSDAGIHTLPIFWADMLLPAHGQIYEPDDWMRALMHLQGDCIYGYEAIGERAYLFAVNFCGIGWAREVQHGSLLNFLSLRTTTVECDWPQMRGRWLVAGLGVGVGGQEKTSERSPWQEAPSHLHIDYAQLNLPKEADFLAVQSAYWRMARKYHPDHNSSKDANVRMRRINESYARIREHWNRSLSP